MGRPSLDVKPTTIRLSEEDRREIVARVGKNRLAEYCRDAVREKLARDRAGSPLSDEQRDDDGGGDWLWLVGEDQPEG